MSSLPRPFFSLLLALGLTLPLLSFRADTLTAAKVTTALDAPAGLTFSSCTGAALRTTYTNDNVGNEEETGKGTVRPVAGANFLELSGSGTPLAKPRSGRIKAAFSFQVQGAGTLTFQHRVNTYGFNDDCLVFYEGDIDGEDAELLSIGGDHWFEVEKDDDGNRWYDVNDDSFWKEDSLFLSTNAYSRTIHVALLAPELGESYEPPYADLDPKGTQPDLQYKAWLDAFVWEPDEDTFLCNILPESGTTFGANGLNVSLGTDYLKDDGTPLFTFRYTLDGSTPSAQSPLYDDQEGIDIQQSCRLRVAIYEGDTLITDSLFADYTLREPPKAPVIQVSPGAPFEAGALVRFYPSEALPYSLEYRYTTDGSEPTAESNSSSYCTLYGPCTLKVRAYDDGTPGEVATFSANLAPAPVVAGIQADGLASSNGVFRELAALFLVARSRPSEGEWDLLYRVRGNDTPPATPSSPLLIGGDTTVEYLLHRRDETSAVFSDGQTFFLDSDVQTCTLRKAQEENAEWLLGQLSRKGWNLVGISRELPAIDQQKLLAWLQPVAFSPDRKIYCLATELAAGNSYWVYLSNDQPPETGKPEAFYSAEASPSQASGSSQWRLVPQDALYFYDGTNFQQAPGVPNDLPGWTNAP